LADFVQIVSIKAVRFATAKCQFPDPSVDGHTLVREPCIKN